jgi:hypothetical protein
VPAVTSNKTSDVPIARRPDMWYDPMADMIYMGGGDFYAFGGSAFNVSVAPGLWGFKPQSNGNVVWQAQHSTLTSNVAGASTATSQTGHISLGGYLVFYQAGSPGDLGYIAMEEMLSYNFTDGSLYNQTLPGQHYILGEAQYIPIYGKEGIILFLGGKQPSDRNFQETTMASFGNILVYDVHTGSFFSQPATNPPSGRYSFCSVAAGGANNQSYEMYVLNNPTQDYKTNEYDFFFKLYLRRFTGFLFKS